MILVLLVFVWTFGLTIGNGLLFHPVLGSAIQPSSRKTPTDFVGALYAGGSSISIVGAGGFSPQTSRYRLIYLFNSVVGLSVTSLTLTYLMQVYSQLQQRNACALKIYLATCQTGDAAVLVAGVAPGGDWSSGTSVLWELASDIAAVKEAHHFYPILFYMRFAEPYYSVTFAALVLLDAVTIIRSALSDRNGTVQKLRALDQIWEGSLLLLTSLEKTFLPQNVPSTQEPGSQQRELWERRASSALTQLQAAGLDTSEYVTAADRYIQLRSVWDSHIQTLAPSMLYSMQQIDPATYGQAH